MLLTIVLIWILLEPTEDQSEAHWLIVIGVTIAIIAMLLIEYVLRKMAKNNRMRFLYEILFLVILFIFWLWMVDG